MKILHLHLKAKWFNQIAEGTKTEEYRLATAHWRKRLERPRAYDEIWLYKGFPKRGDESRVLRRKWAGCVLRAMQHEEFGTEPVVVFAIDVTKKVEGTPC